MDSRARGLSNCRYMGLIALFHVGSFWIRDQIRVPCIVSFGFSITAPPGGALYYRFCKVFIKLFMAKVINVGTQINTHQSQHNMKILIS